MNSGAVVSSTVMVCEPSAVSSIVSGGEGANDHVVAGGIAGSGFAGHLDGDSPQLSDAWRRPSASRRALYGVVGRTKVNSGAVVSSTVMVCVAESCFQLVVAVKVRTIT